MIAPPKLPWGRLVITESGPLVAAQKKRNPRGPDRTKRMAYLHDTTKGVVEMSIDRLVQRLSIRPQSVFNLAVRNGWETVMDGQTAKFKVPSEYLRYRQARPYNGSKSVQAD